MVAYCFFFFFFNDTATTEIYTLSLHDALPICCERLLQRQPDVDARRARAPRSSARDAADRRARGHGRRSEERTSELQSRQYLVCRLLLEKKKKIIYENLHLFKTSNQSHKATLS